MTEAEALTAAKNRLSISGTDFDTQLKDFFDMAVDRLSPKIQQEVDPQTVTPTLDDYGEATVDLSTLSTPLDDVRLVEASSGERWYEVESVFRHGTKLRVRDLESSVTQLKLYGLKAYVVTGSPAAVAGLPERFEIVIMWLMLAEFFDMLSSNKAKFNVYTQQAGGNAVEDMQGEADYYEQKAERYIEDKASLYGA